MEYTALKALVAGTLDYAGMFPPASLTFEKSLEELGLCLRDTPHQWLFAKYVAKLETLTQLKTEVLHQWIPYRTLPVAALGRAWEVGSGEADCWARNLQFELRELQHLQKRALGSSFPWMVVGYETALPEALQGLGDSRLEEVLNQGAEKLREFQLPYLFVELPVKKWGWEKSKTILDRIPFSAPIGIKVRTGGPDAVSAEDLGKLLHWSAQGSLPFKATQGLHAALTTSEGLGFLNLFLALAFSRALGSELSATVLTAILMSPATAFRFEPERVSWRDLHLSREEIERSRRTHRGSFGSCSLREPAESLLQTFSRSET